MALKTIGRGVFCDLLGTRRGMSGLSISVRFRRPYSGFGLTGCTSHSGRRTIITCPAQEIVEMGGSLRDMRPLAGHTNIRTARSAIEGNPKPGRRPSR